MYERIRVNTLPGYENVLDVYEVDRYGNVYGNNGMELTKKTNSNGYLQVALKVKNIRKWKHSFVHRLVGLAFVDGRTEILNEIDHIDTNKLNNNYCNLRWVDRKSNMANPLTKKKLQNNGNPVECYVYDFRLNYVGYYRSLKDAENSLNIVIHSVNSRVLQYYVLSQPNLELVLKINRKYKLQSVVVTDIFTKEKKYFYSNREARRFFDGKVNVTDAIQKNWTVRGKYKVRILNYKKLIGMLDL